MKEESATTTNENVMHISRQSRSRGRNSSRVKKPSSSTGSQQKYHQNEQQYTENNNNNCGRCGQRHRFKCPAMSAKCRSCNVYGHYAKFCLSDN